MKHALPTLAMSLALTLALSLTLPFSTSASPLPENPQAILEQIDANSNHHGLDLSMVATMIIESAEDGVEKNVVRSFRRDEGDQFLMLFQAPENQRGQGYLQVDDVLWFYDPESRKFTHTSIKENFSDSNAKNSDFSSSTYAKDYRITSIEAAQLGQFQAYVLELSATHNDVTYPKKKIWVNQQPNLVLKAEEYSLSERLLRTSYFPSYTRVGDAYLATRMVFVDEVVKGDKTSLSFDKISIAPLADSVFSKAYVERVNR